MNIEFLPIAKLELDDAIEYYELQLEGLGKRYKEEVRTSLNRISIFPYNILYSIHENTILIIAIAHHHREPDYWVDR